MCLLWIHHLWTSSFSVGIVLFSCYMIAIIITGIYRVGLASILTIPTAEAYAILDMTFPTSRTGITCLVPAPKRLTSWLLPFEPFQVTLWIGISGLLILETLGLLFARKMGMGELEEHSWIDSLEFGYISTLKLFISQSTNYVVNSPSVRTVLFSCYMIDIILSSIYSGGLASILTIPSWEEAADTIDRMIKQKLLWGGITADWNFTLKDTQDEKMLEIRSLFRLYSPEELGAQSLTERIGIVFERLQFGHLAIPTYIEQAAINRLKMMTEDIFYEHCVGYTPKGWQLLQNFNNFCIMMQSSGFMKYWEWESVAKYLDENIQKQVEASVYSNFDDTGPVELGIENFAGIVMLWIAGIVLAFLTFIGEVCLFNSREKIY